MIPGGVLVKETVITAFHELFVKTQIEVKILVSFNYITDKMNYVACYCIVDVLPYVLYIYTVNTDFYVGGMHIFSVVFFCHVCPFQSVFLTPDMHSGR